MYIYILWITNKAKKVSSWGQLVECILFSISIIQINFVVFKYSADTLSAKIAKFQNPHKYTWNATQMYITKNTIHYLQQKTMKLDGILGKANTHHVVKPDKCSSRRLTFVMMANFVFVSLWCFSVLSHVWRHSIAIICLICLNQPLYISEQLFGLLCCRP